MEPLDASVKSRLQLKNGKRRRRNDQNQQIQTDDYGYSHCHNGNNQSQSELLFRQLSDMDSERQFNSETETGSLTSEYLAASSRPTRSRPSKKRSTNTKTKSDDEFNFLGLQSNWSNSPKNPLFSMRGNMDEMMGNISYDDTLTSLTQKNEAIERLKNRQIIKKIETESKKKLKDRDHEFATYIGWPSESESSSSSDDEKLLSRILKKRKRTDTGTSSKHNETSLSGLLHNGNASVDSSRKKSHNYSDNCNFKRSSVVSKNNVKPNSFKQQKVANHIDYRKSNIGIGSRSKKSVSDHTLFSNEIILDQDISRKNKLINNGNSTSPVFKKQKLPMPNLQSVNNTKEVQPVTGAYTSIICSPDLFSSPPNNSMSEVPVFTPETPSFLPQQETPKSRPPAPESPDLVFLGISSPELNFSSPFKPKKRISRVKNRDHSQQSKGATCSKKSHASKTEDDVVQLVEQLNKDEDYARKLQEEMDKEFALSLAQCETSDFNPPPMPNFISPNQNGFHRNFVNAPHFDHMQTAPYNRPGNITMHPRMNRRRADEFLENHFLALVQGTPPRRGRRRNQRQTRPILGIPMLQSPIGDGNDYEALLHLAEQVGDAQSKGINEGQINRLPVKKFQKTAANVIEECSICMCEYEDNESMRILPCFHCFHPGCVDKWLGNNASCPVCRIDIKLD